MRTTLTLDDDLATALKQAAHATDRTFKAMVNEALRAGLAVIDRAPETKAYRVEPVDLGGALPGIDLDKALRLADALEDDALRHKLEQRK